MDKGKEGMNFMIIDMTSQDDALKTLGEYLGIDPEEIFTYIKPKSNLTVDDFIEYFKINLDELINKELYLCCLHVTTNNDNCKSIKEYGLTNLQKSIKLNTPLGKYLREKGIDIDIENKIINYNGKEFDISLKKDKIEHSNMVNYKLFRDYQINAFFSYDNVLDYGGGVSWKPEILHNLSELISDRNINYDWLKRNNKCYVIKYKAKLKDFTYYTFELPKNYYLDDNFYNEKRKIKWVIKSCIDIIYRNISMPEIYAYMNFDVVIPYSDIVDIYSEEEYKTKFNIN